MDRYLYSEWCPYNNWNLHKSNSLNVAMVLEDNGIMPTAKGGNIISTILNRTSARQWSLADFMKYGYDFNTEYGTNVPVMYRCHAI